MHRGEKLLYMHMVIRLRKWKNGVDQGTPYSIKVEPFIDGCVFAHFNSNNLLPYFILGKNETCTIFEQWPAILAK